MTGWPATLGYSRKELLGMHYRGYCDGRNGQENGEHSAPGFIKPTNLHLL